MLHLDNIKLELNSFKLQVDTLQVQKNEILSLLGPSGAGKSTLLKTVLGVYKPNSGKIIYKNRDITNSPLQKRGFGYVPQHLSLFSNLNVYNNIIFPIKAQKKDFDKRYMQSPIFFLEITSATLSS